MLYTLNIMNRILKRKAKTLRHTLDTNNNNKYTIMQSKLRMHTYFYSLTIELTEERTKTSASSCPKSG